MSENGKQPLRKWVPPSMVITRNSRYESQGNITLTMPLEFAALIVGLLGACPIEKKLKDGGVLVTSALYDALAYRLQSDFPMSHPIRQFGREIVREGTERPAYMRNDP